MEVKYDVNIVKYVCKYCEISCEMCVVRYHDIYTVVIYHALCCMRQSCDIL